MTKRGEKDRIIVGDNMKSKDKAKKQIKLTIKRIIIFSAFSIIILYGIIFYNYYLVKNEVLAKEVNSNTDYIKKLEISNAEQINLDDIIETNNKSNQKEEYYVEEAELEYIKKYK